MRKKSEKSSKLSPSASNFKTATQKMKTRERILSKEKLRRKKYESLIELRCCSLESAICNCEKFSTLMNSIQVASLQRHRCTIKYLHSFNDVSLKLQIGLFLHTNRANNKLHNVKEEEENLTVVVNINEGVLMTSLIEYVNKT